MFASRLTLARRALLTSSLAASAVTLHEPKEKLSIYPNPVPETILLDTPSALEKQIGEARRTVTSGYRDTYAQVQGVVSKWIGVEHAVENRVKSLISPTEPLTPGILYVGVSTLTGSILARNRFILTRLLLPPAAFIVSLDYFLPQTTHNVATYLGELEQKYLPEVKRVQDTGIAHSSMGLEMAKAKFGEGKVWVDESAKSGVDALQRFTGLKLGELGWGKEKTGQVEEKKVV